MKSTHNKQINFSDRPSTWRQYIGQEKIIESLQIMLASAQKQNKALDHLLIHGASGMGKTSLALLLANVSNHKIHILNGPTLQKPSDLIAVLTSIKDKDFVFIDEIHAVDKEVLELLYPVLEDNYLNLIIGKEYNSKIVHVKLPNFTMICATTEITKLAKPFMNRFPLQIQLQQYTLDDMSKIILSKALKMNLDFSKDQASYLALYTRKTPRICVSLLNRIYDYFVVGKITDFSQNSIDIVLNALEIYKYGLNQTDINYLKLVSLHQPIGLETIAQIINLPLSTVALNIEPLLIQENLIRRSFNGRIIAEMGMDLLKQLEL